MAHCISPAAEAILDKSFDVLDKGFVKLIDYNGNDDRIVQAARVSYGKGTKTALEDAKLIDYLMAHHHNTPLEMVSLTFHCKMPIFVARQWIRTRTAHTNELSGRYSVMPNEAYVPTVERLGKQSTTNKQGTSDANEFADEVKAGIRWEFVDGQTAAFDRYNELIDPKVDLARELARINLPLSTYTEWYWQIDLHNLFHFLGLRLDSHAQWEIQQYGIVMAEMTKAVAPAAYAAFESNHHNMNGARFSHTELQALNNMLSGMESGLTGRKSVEFENKLKRGAITPQ